METALMSITARLPAFSSEAGLSRYLAEIRKFPLLAPEQEFADAKKWRDHGDRAAAYRLVTSHLRLAAKIAMRYRRYGLPIADIVSEANVGLMQAVKRFEPERGFRLATYAMWWIRASIQEYILRSWSLVKMGTTAGQKKLFFNLRRLKNRLSVLHDGDLRPEQVSFVAEHLGVSKQDVVEMNHRLRGDASLNTPARNDEASGEWQDRLVDHAPDPELLLAEREEYEHRCELLRRAMAVLSARERHILEARQLADEPKTLDELAGIYGVSRERVRQIEQRAFEKVKAAARCAAAKALDQAPPPLRALTAPPA